MGLCLPECTREWTLIWCCIGEGRVYLTWAAYWTGILCNWLAKCLIWRLCQWACGCCFSHSLCTCFSRCCPWRKDLYTRWPPGRLDAHCDQWFRSRGPLIGIWLHVFTGRIHTHWWLRCWLCKGIGTCLPPPLSSLSNLSFVVDNHHISYHHLTSVLSFS